VTIVEEIPTELSGNVLELQFNRLLKKTAMTLVRSSGDAEQLDQTNRNDYLRTSAVRRLRQS
jgi:hypothetical protein